MEEGGLGVGVAGATLAGVAGSTPERSEAAAADGLRTARITEAALASAAAHQWVDVPAPEPMEVAT